MTRIYKDKEAMRQKLKDAWTPERKAAFGQLVRERFATDPYYKECIAQSVRGIPKSPEQKQKMREAKLDVPKSNDHRDAMRRAHLLRHHVIGHIMEAEGCDYQGALSILRKDKEYLYELYSYDFE